MGKLFAFACVTTGVYFAVAVFALMHPVAWTPSSGQSQGVATQRTVRAPLKSNDLERNRSEGESAFLAPGPLTFAPAVAGALLPTGTVPIGTCGRSAASPVSMKESAD